MSAQHYEDRIARLSKRLDKLRTKPYTTELNHEIIKLMGEINKLQRKLMLKLSKDPVFAQIRQCLG